MPRLSLRRLLSKQYRRFCTSASSRACDPINSYSTRAPGRVCRASLHWQLVVGGRSPVSARCWGCKTEQDLEGLIFAVEQEVGLNLLSKLGVNAAY